MPDAQLALLDSMICRAEKLLVELEAVYARDLNAHQVSPDALNITHEIVEKCSNVLDQAMTLVFERQIKPVIAEPPTRGGYFPAARDEQSYRSTLGQWRATDLQNLLPDLDEKLRSLQPFTNPSNAIFARIKELASKKHTALEPQIRTEERQVSVTAPGGGGVSWGPGVTFGSGVSVMGVPIDPRTQMPVHSQGINIQVENWVSFMLVEGGENALAFCKNAVESVRSAIVTLFN
jgi:hypothetical protein